MRLLCLEAVLAIRSRQDIEQKERYIIASTTAMEATSDGLKK